MGTISSSIGLVTGFPIQDTVNKLVAIEAAPRDALTAANKTLGDKQVAITTLETLITGLQIASSKLSGKLLYSEQTVASSNPNALGVSTTGPVAAGSYQFTPIRQVQAQQFTSSRIASDTAALGGGSFSLRAGGFVDPGVSVDLLNYGEGFDRGSIQITDRSGAQANVDLSLARTIDDVVQTINSAAGIHVTAQAVGNHLRLIDDTGKTTANLQVSEVTDGTTAASLGLAGINVAASGADGSDILHAFNEMSLANLNQGNGVQFDNALSDMQISFRDGTRTTVDFHRLAISGTQAAGATQGNLGSNARLTFRAVQAGSAYAGVKVIFQDDSNIVAGSNESVAYDANAKTLTFHIRAGQTTASNIVDALKRNPTVSPLFTAANAAGSDGTGLVSVSDTTTLDGPPSTAVMPGSAGTNARIAFTAVTPGAAGDGVTIQYVDNPAILAGQETVAYDSNTKQLVFQIAAGQTTANQVIDALNNDATARQYFTAATAPGSNGTDVVSVNDTVTTSGGALLEPVAGTNEATLGDVLNVLNNVAPGKLKAEIAPDGNHLLLTDLTSNTGGTFSLSDLNHSRVVENLGLSTTASGGTITSDPLLAGLKTSLLSNLNGGRGISNLGLLQLTDRSGATATVDLSQAQTLDDVINTINGANLGIVAAVNQARDGIQLTDTTGATASNLIVANGNDQTTTADRLGISVNAATTSVNSGDLKLQVISENTALAGLNAGAGVPQGTFTITDTNGITATARITAGQHTIGDVIDEINSLGLAINARINDAGDGIALVDTGGGTSTLSVAEGNGTTGAALHLVGSAKTVTINGQPTQVIDGSTTQTITLSATDSLQDLVKKINDANIGATASVFSNGSSVKPFQLVLTSQVAGKAGELRIDTSQLPFSLNETVQAQDALLMVNTAGSNGQLVSSTTNTFKNVLPGATLTVNGTSDTPVTVSSTSTDKTLAAAVSAIVDGYNSIHSKIADLTAFDPTSGTGAVLQADTSVLRAESDLADLFTSRFFGAGKTQSLQELGINVQSDGSLVFDQTAFDAKFNADPTSVQSFFTTAQNGFVDKLKALTNQLAGPTDSVLSGKGDSLTSTIQNNQDRIDTLTAHLNALQLRLLTSFYNAELAIAKIRNNLNALSSISSFTFTNLGGTNTTSTLPTSSTAPTTTSTPTLA